jgi:hypothetical protein
MYGADVVVKTDVWAKKLRVGRWQGLLSGVHRALLYAGPFDYLHNARLTSLLL